jgi:hypothetical protein
VVLVGVGLGDCWMVVSGWVGDALGLCMGEVCFEGEQLFHVDHPSGET